MDAILQSHNPLWMIAATVAVVGGTFAATWLSLHLARRRLERRLTAMQSEAWVELFDAVEPRKPVDGGGPTIQQW